MERSLLRLKTDILTSGIQDRNKDLVPAVKSAKRSMNTEGLKDTLRQTINHHYHHQKQCRTFYDSDSEECCAFLNALKLKEVKEKSETGTELSDDERRTMQEETKRSCLWGRRRNESYCCRGKLPCGGAWCSVDRLWKDMDWRGWRRDLSSSLSLVPFHLSAPSPGKRDTQTFTFLYIIHPGRLKPDNSQIFEVFRQLNAEL